VLLPIPFNDFTTHDASTGETTYVVGGKSSEGIKFVALELPSGGKPPPDLAAIPKSLAANPANKVSDVSRSAKGDADVLTLTVADGSKTLYSRPLRSGVELSWRGGRSPQQSQEQAQEFSEPGEDAAEVVAHS
jgi:hypothetical protein